MKTINVAGVDVNLVLEDDEVVLDAVVLLRVTRLQDGRGQSMLIIGTGEETDLTVEVGMLDRAHHMILQQSRSADDE